MSYLLLFFLATAAYPYSDGRFQIEAPAKHTEEPKMFGSDVLFLPEGAKGSGSTFVKYLQNKEVVPDYQEFLKNHLLASRSLKPKNIISAERKRVHGHELFCSTFEIEGSAENGLACMLAKDTKEYLFIMFKDYLPQFYTRKNAILKSLETVKFIK